MSDTKHILYVLNSDVDRPPAILYAPFALATIAKTMNIDATIYIMGTGSQVLKKGVAETIKSGNLPTLEEMINQALKAGVELMVCSQSMRILKIETVDIIPEAKVVGFAVLNNLALEVDATMWF